MTGSQLTGDETNFSFDVRDRIDPRRSVGFKKRIFEFSLLEQKFCLFLRQSRFFFYIHFIPCLRAKCESNFAIVENFRLTVIESNVVELDLDSISELWVLNVVRKRRVKSVTGWSRESYNNNSWD